MIVLYKYIRGINTKEGEELFKLSTLSSSSFACNDEEGTTDPVLLAMQIPNHFQWLQKCFKGDTATKLGGSMYWRHDAQQLGYSSPKLQMFQRSPYHLRPRG
ncbi:unnamed protein product [Caretta caretta]